MTASQRQQYIITWHRFQQRHEAIFTNKFKAALQIQAKQFLRNKKVMDVTAYPIYVVLKELYETVGPLWAYKTGIHKIKREVKSMPMGFSERIVALMKQYYGIDLLNDAEGITSYTREVIQDILSNAAQSGDSIFDIVKAITDSSELGEMRARRIARTETVTAANGAAIINAKESGILMRKEWIAITDKRTRHTHFEVDGVTIDINTPFDVGGTLMMQPGVRTQPNGLETPAKETINCRCTTGFIPVRGKDGRLVMTQVAAL